MKDIPRVSIRELAHIIKDYKTPRFAFFLGAGASRQSGIPIASDMIREFKEKIIARCCPNELKIDKERTKWLDAQDWYQADGNEYCKCFEKFEPKETGRQRYIERIIEGRAPSFGYVVLANLMASGHINTIITTNFDDLVYSACTTFTGIRPIVYAYGVLASEMRLTAQRPKILKLHGDYLYSALKNTDSELDSQDQNMERQVRQVLGEYGLIVIGYGGGDKSIMKILSDISERNDLYWCIRRGEKINEAVEKLLRDKRGFLVEIEGFDEMMNEVRRIVEFDVKRMVGSIEERRNQIIKQLETFEPQYSAEILEEIVDAIKEPVEKGNEDKNLTALAFAARAYKAQEVNDLYKAEELYRKAIELKPDSNSYNNLGAVLYKLERYDDAEAVYRKAIMIDSNNAIAHKNLGMVLYRLERYDESEAAYRRSTELSPNDAVAYNGLGILLKSLERYGEAEAAYHKAIEINPSYTFAYVNLSTLLRLIGRQAEALTFAKAAQQFDPSPDVLLNIAALHKKLGHKTESNLYAVQARELFKPDDWYGLACLESVCSNIDAAIENLRQAAQQPNFDHDWARRDPDLEWIRDDPRFKEIVGEESV